VQKLVPAPAPLAGDDVDEPGRRVLPADDGLDDPDLADGGRHLVEGHGVHVLAGSRRVGLKLGQGHLEKLVGKIGSYRKIFFLVEDGSVGTRTVRGDVQAPTDYRGHVSTTAPNPGPGDNCKRRGSITSEAAKKRDTVRARFGKALHAMLGNIKKKY
jgi:hypothetical protein